MFLAQHDGAQAATAKSSRNRNQKMKETLPVSARGALVDASEVNLSALNGLNGHMHAHVQVAVT